MSNPTIESTNVVLQALCLIQADANGQAIATITNIFGEQMDQAAQVQQARATVARFASVFCAD